jgi:hypothetical protein
MEEQFLTTKVRFKWDKKHTSVLHIGKSRTTGTDYYYIDPQRSGMQVFKQVKLKNEDKQKIWLYQYKDFIYLEFSTVYQTYLKILRTEIWVLMKEHF